MLYFIFSIRLPRKKIILTPSILLLTCNNSTRQRFFRERTKRFWVVSLLILENYVHMRKGPMHTSTPSSHCPRLITQSLVAKRFTIMGFQVEKSPAMMCWRASPTSQR